MTKYKCLVCGEMKCEEENDVCDDCLPAFVEDMDDYLNA